MSPGISDLVKLFYAEQFLPPTLTRVLHEVLRRTHWYGDDGIVKKIWIMTMEVQHLMVNENLNFLELVGICLRTCAGSAIAGKIADRVALVSEHSGGLLKNEYVKALWNDTSASTEFG